MIHAEPPAAPAAIANGRIGRQQAEAAIALPTAAIPARADVRAVAGGVLESWLGAIVNRIHGKVHAVIQPQTKAPYFLRGGPSVRTPRGPTQEPSSMSSGSFHVNCRSTSEFNRYSLRTDATAGPRTSIFAGL
jgi:hypothetical protein